MAPVARRSCLSVPASSEKMVGKAPTLPADELILDLEDAVRPADKDTARERACAAPAGWDRVVAVRCNAPGTPWCHLDLAALATAEGVASVIVPKVQSPDDLAFVDRLLDGAEAAAGRAEPLRVQALIENAAGLAHATAIAASSPRLDTLILGYADLAASLGVAPEAAKDPDRWAPAQHALLVAARAAGVQAIDGPWLGTQDDEPFRAAATRARDLGFDGKWAIHPRQTAALDELFAPGEDEVAHARAVLEALDGASGGAVELDGEMLDEALAVAARRTLARAGAAA